MSSKRWIQNAELNEGTLIRYVQRTFRSNGFTERGTIRVELLRNLSTNSKVHEITRKRARLVLTLRKYRR